MKRFFPRPWLAGLLCALALPAWAAFTDNGDGTITYTPKSAGYRGTDTFQYTVNDNVGATSNVATVRINVVQ